jgi:hypothetical protein
MTDLMMGVSKDGTEIRDEALEKVSGELWPEYSKTIDLSGGGIHGRRRRVLSSSLGCSRLWIGVERTPPRGTHQNFWFVRI